jgi:hypothetical protein
MNEIEVIEQKHLFTSGEKLKYLGYGEWVEELDLLIFKYKEYKAKIIRIMMQEAFHHWCGGYLCGYIFIPPKHPWFQTVDDMYEGLPCQVHYGLTYGQFDKDSGCYVIGFDCSHCFDIVPSMELLKKSSYLKKNLTGKFNSTYKNMDFCINECKSMIDQAIDAEKLDKEEKK